MRRNLRGRLVRLEQAAPPDTPTPEEWRIVLEHARQQATAFCAQVAARRQHTLTEVSELSLDDQVALGERQRAGMQQLKRDLEARTAHVTPAMIKAHARELMAWRGDG